MSKHTLEERVAKLEEQVASVLANGVRPTTDWRSVVDKYAGDEGLLEIFREAMKLREADRQRFYREYDRKYRKKRAAKR